jgi:hypothetical protein
VLISIEFLNFLIFTESKQLFGFFQSNILLFAGRLIRVWLKGTLFVVLFVPAGIHAVSALPTRTSACNFPTTIGNLRMEGKFLIASALNYFNFSSNLSEMHPRNSKILEGTVDSMNFGLSKFEKTFLILFERLFNDYISGSPASAGPHRHSAALHVGNAFEESFNG